MADLLLAERQLCHSHAGPSGRIPAALRLCTRRTRPALQQQRQAGNGRARRLLTQATAAGVLDRTEQYNLAMAQQMGWSDPYEYHYERGLYYHEVAPNLFCGTQMRHVGDVEELKARERIDVVLNLQQDRDLDHWGVDFHSVYHRAKALGVRIERKPARDFDPHSLRHTLPGAVRCVAANLAAGRRVYVHCTAGLGRAPAVCIAYLFWFTHAGLDQAYKQLTDIRPCGPKRDAVRGATYDLLDGGHADAFSSLPPDAYAQLSEEDRHALQYRVLNWRD